MLSSRRWGAAGVVLAAALCAAPGCGRGKSTPELTAQLKSPGSAERLRAAKGLGGRRDEAALAVPALAAALKDEDAFVRRGAAEGLGQFGPGAASAAPALVAALRDRNRAVRKAAAEALKKVAPEAIPHPGKR
jgi:HEAT repeat protein